MSVDHYENFPVASWLCPQALRPAIRAIYAFARTADDLADEGSAGPEERLRTLAAYRLDLLQTAAGTSPSARWSSVFLPLQQAMVRHHLPTAPFADLLDAFEQDVRQHRYADRAELLEYCRRSAHPVGRLLLHLYGVHDAQSLQQSDAICAALQLINFWQDLSVDTVRDRLYVPLADCARRGVEPAALLARQDSPAARALIAELAAWSQELMHRGAPLALRLPGRAGWELRLVVQGGLRILQLLQQRGHDALLHRPALRRGDAPAMLWQALRMRAPVASARKTA